MLIVIYRERVTKLTLLAKNSTRQVSDTEVLEFYNLATSKMLTGLEVNFIIYYFQINRYLLVLTSLGINLKIG